MSLADLAGSALPSRKPFGKRGIQLPLPTGRKWYFLVKYEGTRIQPSAWVECAARGKKLNQEFSLGLVRYAAGSETETDIRLRAESQGFRPNIRNTQAEALQRIEEMKAANAKSSMDAEAQTSATG